MAFNWISNTGIVSGLSEFGNNTVLSVFEYNGNFYLIAGNDAAGCNAYIFSNGSWVYNSAMSSFSSAPLINAAPVVFTLNSDLYLILGNYFGHWKGYKWNGTQWVYNTAIITGLPDVGASSTPTVFYKDSNLYLISGIDTGLFKGFLWNGSAWVADNGIITGLPDVGSSSTPAVFYKDSNLYLISGINTGLFRGFMWDGTAWVSDNVIITGLPDVGAFSAPAIFYKDSILYLISGNAVGTFDGFNDEYIAPPPPAKLDSFLSSTTESGELKLTLTCSEEITAVDTLKIYFSLNPAGLIDPANIVEFQTSDNIIFEKIISIGDGLNYYASAHQIVNEEIIDSIDINATFYEIAQKPTTLINIIGAQNHITLNSPIHRYTHGFLFLNGFLFGSARFSLSTSIFKLNAADYSIIAHQTIYENKNTSVNQISIFDQIVYCSGFLWCQSGNGNYLVRINPIDLDYIVFSGAGLCSGNQPIGTDGTHLFYNSDEAIIKLDTNVLINSFASYGYDGNNPVAIPVGALIGSCPLIQYHTTEKIGVHSIICDNNFIYVAATSSSITNGFDSDLQINLNHLQKINKSTMSTVQDVNIPKCTDDMCQNAKYIFLAPEYEDSSFSLLGENFGLIAINKSTLEIKYLKALHSDFNTLNESDRQCFGVFLFNNFIIVQLVKSKKSIVINLADIEIWGESFPIGGATEAVYLFNIEGIALTSAPNELVIDNTNMIHVTTWDQSNTTIFKFSDAQFPGIDKTPIIQTSLIATATDTATLGGYIIDEGKSPITSGGFNYGTAPDALNINVPVTPFSYDFQTILNSLAPGVYYFQAYGTNTEGTFFGNTVIFTILPPAYNSVTLSHDNTIALLALLDGHNGHSIRCVQNAPGEITGTTGTATDQDGNIYDTIVINEKRWMIQNLKAKHYRNGDPIANITDAEAWELDQAGAWCSYQNKPSNI